MGSPFSMDGDYLKKKRDLMGLSTATRICGPLNACWDEQIIQQIFLPNDAAAILQIPVCTRNMDDFWSWGFEKNGLFTVRSAYKMIVATKKRREDWLDERPGPSNTAQNEKSWEMLWHVAVPAKIRSFL